ncbi:MAG: DHH family phosphoesterase [Candidatus Wildermuthbacteria bacterium]|nr:DHH family phosphoesterase [Candidatus Wildermuthbacteria bacterium]
MEIKNLKKAAQRIKKAVKQKERIILYGDSDLDGVCSVIILQETLLSLGGNISALYFPDREQEGYGITKTALEQLKSHAPGLLVSMDLGITNFEEIRQARAMGLEVILVDHHEILDVLPQANIIVDPKQPGETYPFHGFAACGLTLRLALLLLNKDASPALVSGLKELAALATVADMMPRKEDNLQIIQEGLATISQSWRPGLKAFERFEEFKRIESVEVRITQMIALLNVRDVEYGIPAAYRVLAAKIEQEAVDLLSVLQEKHKIRKENIRMYAERVRSCLARTSRPAVVVEGDGSFDYLLLGSVASIISQEYNIPAFIYKRGESESIGSARAPSGYDTVQAMKAYAALLITYGGHAQASGFRLRNENLEKFKDCLVDYFTNHQPVSQ